MSKRFDPNLPGLIVGDCALAITERPAVGLANLVVNGAKPFDIRISWDLAGPLVPLWLTALSVKTDHWVVTAYVESQGPGPELTLAHKDVPIGGEFTDPMHYQTTITVPAGTLPEENPGDPSVSGLYKIIVTVFLDSAITTANCGDMMGYAEGPIIKVENPR